MILLLSFGLYNQPIKDWEQGRCPAYWPALRAYLMIIQKDPKTVLKILRDAGKNSGKRAA